MDEVNREKTESLASNAFLAACQTNLPRVASLSYEPSEQHPFGRANPEAPPELAQFHFMVGKNDCSEQRLNNATGDWVEGSRTWDGHYFMNGFGIRDGESPELLRIATFVSMML